VYPARKKVSIVAVRCFQSWFVCKFKKYFPASKL